MKGEGISNKLRIFSRSFSYLGSFVLFAMMLLTVMDVGGRYLFNRPIVGTFELTQYMVLILIFSFLGDTQAHNDHVQVDLFVKKFPRQIRMIIGFCNNLVCMFLVGLMAWMSFLRALELKDAGEASSNLGIPAYPFAYFLVAGCGVLFIEYFRNLLQSIHGTKEEPVHES